MTERLHRLANGLRVAVAPMSGVETAAIGVYVDAGSRSEPARLSGLAHLFEHMVFKGAGGRNAKAIAEDMEDVGGQLNAWTSREGTAFHARLLAADLPLGMELVADLIRAPHLDEGELEREKAVVLAELGEVRDTPDDIVFDHLQASAYPDQPLGRPVLGDEAGIAAVDAAALRWWAATQYRPEGLVIAAAGKVDEDALLRRAEALFGDMEAGRAPPPPQATWAAAPVHDTRRFDQVHLAIGWPGLDQQDPDVHALALFAGVAGGGSSSRLFQEVREARGLAYSVYAWSQAGEGHGMLGAYVAASRAAAPRALQLVRDEVAGTAGSMTAAELERARAQARAGLLMGLEGVQGRCDHLARQIQIHGRIVPVGETIAELDAVTLEQARAAGERALSGREALASVGGRLARAA